MSKVINEQVKVQRGWNGKLERINAICFLIIEAELTTKKLATRFDKATRQYQRFYNDGDFPRLVSAYGVRSWEEKSV